MGITSFKNSIIIDGIVIESITSEDGCLDVTVKDIHMEKPISLKIKDSQDLKIEKSKRYLITDIELFGKKFLWTNKSRIFYHE